MAAAGMLAAIAITVTVGPRPAHADTSSFLGPVTEAYRTLAAGGQPAQVVQRVVTIVNGIRGSLLAEMRQLPASDARTCAERHVAEFSGLRQLSPTAARRWASDAAACAARIDGLLAVTADQATVDRLGLAVNGVGPIALAAALHTALANGSLRQVLVRANEAVLSKTAPRCSEFPVFIDVNYEFEWWYRCLAYTFTWPNLVGEAFHLQLVPIEQWGMVSTPEPIKQQIQLQATRHTSWAIAKTVLPLI